MKAIVCLLVVVALAHAAEEKKTEKRGIYGLGYGLGAGYHAPLLGAGYHAPLLGAGYHAPLLGAGYHAPLVSHAPLYGGAGLHGLYGGYYGHGLGLYNRGLYGHGLGAPLLGHGAVIPPLGWH